MTNSYGKKEKLKSQKLIEILFSEGKSVSVYPLRMVFLKTTDSESASIKCGVSVSKRNFKKAVDRNHIKRLLRESYRLNKIKYFNNISSSYAFMILYISKDGIDFDSLDKKMNLLLDKFSKLIAED
jgi:ribonuclease P protein component